MSSSDADPEWPESGTVSGREAVWDFIVSLTDAWDGLRDGEVIDAGTTGLLARSARPVRGKASGIADVLDYWCVAHSARARSRHRVVRDRDEALEAVGLSE